MTDRLQKEYAFVTPEARARMRADMVRVAPGLYQTPDGRLCCVLSEILEATGWPVTPATLDLVQRVYEQKLAAGGVTHVVEQDLFPPRPKARP